MNSFVSDPGIWILVAMVACLHATYLITRRMPGPVRGQQVGLGVLFSFTFGLLMYVLSARPSPQGWVAPPLFVLATPLICGIIVGSRAKEVCVAIGCFVVAITVSYFISNWAMDAPFTARTISASEAPFTIAAQRVAAIKGPIKPGFLETATLGLPRDFTGTGTRIAAWHTFITGVPAWRIYPYRVWTPGGDPKKAAAAMRLVLAGDPEPSPANLSNTRTTTVAERLGN